VNWNDVRVQLHRSWQVLAESRESCHLEVVCDGQQRLVRVQRALGGPAIVLSAPVCAAHHITPGEALAYNGRAEMWALGLSDAVYVLRRALALSSLAAGELDEAIGAIADAAERLHRLQVPPRQPRQRLSAARFALWYAS
jgi:hypothetical protein